MPGKGSGCTLAKCRRCIKRTKLDCRDRGGQRRRNAVASSRKKQGTISVAPLVCFGGRSDRRGRFVAKLQAAGTNHVFLCSAGVPCTRHCCSSERANRCRGRLSGIGTKGCHLDLRTGIVGRKKCGGH